MTNDLYHKIVSERGSLERLVARIPGFKGYQDMQARRTADRMLRDHIADQLSQRIDRFIRVEKAILDGGGLKHMSRTRDLKSKFQRYRDLIRTEAPGYSGMWAQVKIGPEELDRIYSFDEAQIRYVDRLDEAVSALDHAARSEDGDLGGALNDFDALLDEAIEAYNLRDSVLTNLGKTL